MIEDEYEEMIEIIPVSHISEVLDVALEGEPEKDSLVDRLKSRASTRVRAVPARSRTTAVPTVSPS